MSGGVRDLKMRFEDTHHSEVVRVWDFAEVRVWDFVLDEHFVRSSAANRKFGFFGFLVRADVAVELRVAKFITTSQ